MTKVARQRISKWSMAAAITASVLALAPAAMAEDAKLVVTGAAPIRDTLKTMTGAKVSLRTVSGEEIGGTVAETGENAVRLTELTGRELFDAVVRLDHVSAVIVRKAK